MYADDGSPEELQAMLHVDIVHNYAQKWRYNLNANKSVVMVLGETSCTRKSAHSTRNWTIGNEVLKEVDEQHHLLYLGLPLTLPFVAQMREQQLAEVRSML